MPGKLRVVFDLFRSQRTFLHRSSDCSAAGFHLGGVTGEASPPNSPQTDPTSPPVDVELVPKALPGFPSEEQLAISYEVGTNKDWEGSLTDPHRWPT